MPKIKLDELHLWKGVQYGPGEVEVPESFVSAYNLSPETPSKTKIKPSKEPTEEKTE